MTEDAVERIVCSRVDAIDRRYLRGELTEEQYRREIDALDKWAAQALRTKD